MIIQLPTDPAFFSISADLESRLLRYKIAKLWDMETFDRYTEAVLVEMRKFKDVGLSFDSIGDLTEFPPQNQFLNEARQVLDTKVVGMGLRKAAVIVSGVISKLQLARLIGDSVPSDRYQFFTSESEALAWIRE